ncbi:hypothetical protein [Mycolicibacterium lutetiense]
MTGMTGNELLAQATMIPIYHQVRFAALGSRTVPEFDDDADEYLADESSIHVYTFADDQNEHADRTVDIYVYRGADTARLGRLIFDTPLNFRQPQLTFGSILEIADYHPSRATQPNRRHTYPGPYPRKPAWQRNRHHQRPHRRQLARPPAGMATTLESLSRF